MLLEPAGSSAMFGGSLHSSSNRSDEASQGDSENRGFCSEKVHGLVAHKYFFDSIDRSVRSTVSTSELILVLFIPTVSHVRVVVRISALLFILFSLVAVRVSLEVVVLGVAFHPFDRFACASIQVYGVDCGANEIATLTEGLRCHSGCQHGKSGSFHFQKI